jgi:hypothetical protein
VFVCTFSKKVYKLQAILIIENTQEMTMENELGLKVQSCAFTRVPKFGKRTNVWQKYQRLAKVPTVGKYHRRLATTSTFGKSTKVWQNH